jgi:hypothetical protein
MDACNETFHIYFRQFIEMMKNMDKKDDINSDSQTNNINTNNLIDSRVYLENKANDDSKNDNDIVEFIEDFNFSGKYKYTIIICFLLYILLKIVVGIFRLIILPKGYDKYVAKSLQEEGKLENIDREEQKAFLQRNADEELLLTEDIDYNPFFDLESYFSLKLKIFKFFDFFSDFSILTTKRNRYYNDNGLEVINFLRTIVLYFYIFSNSFTTLIDFPSKDKLNKAFFSSNLLFFYRFSTHSITCWIFLEASYTAYKLMKFIKIQMYDNNSKKRNNICNTNLLIVYGKFILLFIPKICIFFFCFYTFYYDILKFVDLFSAKTTFRYVVERIINKNNNITCNNQASVIFSTFKSDTQNFNTCFDFTFIYINIFFVFFVF